jgi:hypothetical protein
MSKIRPWLAGLATTLTVVVGCGDEGGSCTDTYAEGPGYSFSGTSCDDKKPPQSVVDSAADAGVGADAGCADIQAYGCKPGTSDCDEVYRRACGAR